LECCKYSGGVVQLFNYSSPTLHTPKGLLIYVCI
jgi:hypothetical protein